MLQDVIHVTETPVGRRYAGWFLRHNEHALRVGEAIRRSPLPTMPIPKKANGATSGTKDGIANGDSSVTGTSAGGKTTKAT